MFLRMKIPAFLLLLLTASCPAQSPPAPALPGKWKLVPEFTDDFDTPKLDPGK